MNNNVRWLLWVVVIVAVIIALVMIIGPSDAEADAFGYWWHCFSYFPRICVLMSLLKYPLGFG